jgi:UDP-glucose 4-epimerase
VKVLVTGGCGFVGRHLVARLAATEDAEIWVVDDLSTGRHPATWDSPATVTSHRQPYRSALVFELAGTSSQLVFVNAPWQSIASVELDHQPGYGHPPLPHFDEVYHLASVVGGRAMIDGDPLAVGIDLAIDSSLYLWAVKVGRPDRLLYASSSAAYPVSQQTDEAAVALTEEMLDPKAGFLQPDMTYGWSKLTGEYLGQMAAERYGLSVAVVRPFSGYGEDQDLSYPVPAIALRVAARQDPVRVWGSGLQGRDFVHIDDCVEACIRACRRISDGSAVNIGSGALTSFRELAALMVELEGYEAPVEGTDDKPVGVAQRYCDPTRMHKLLDWEPEISLRDGIERVLVGARSRLAAGLTPVV